jgi:lipid-binding SYLF domain-containing protein
MKKTCKFLIIGCSLFLLTGLQLTSFQSSAIADEDFTAAQQEDEFKELTPAEIESKRQEILNMAEETLARLYKEHPKAEDEIKNAYGYGVFEGHSVNLIMYVAGKGVGVVYDNKTQTPIYMDAIRMGTGPGVGFKSLHFVLIFNNELVFDQFTTVGLQVSASGDASLKIAGKGAEAGKAISLVPGVSAYQLIDTGLLLQANWGATEFLKDPDLNKKMTSEKTNEETK